jgi:hypothetical protein
VVDDNRDAANTLAMLLALIGRGHEHDHQRIPTLLAY